MHWRGSSRLPLVIVGFLLTGVSLGAPAPGAAQNTDVPQDAPLTPVPLVAVEGALTEIGGPLTPDPNINVSLALFALPSGDVVDSQFSHGGLPLSIIGQGSVTPALLDELRQALAAAQVGVQHDCGINGSEIFTSFTTITVTLDWQITWFGRHGRRNQFRVTTLPGLPACPREVLNLIREIFRFRSQFYSLPTTRVLYSLPH